MTRKLKKRQDPEFPPIHILMCGGRDFDDDYVITLLVVGLKYYHGLNVHLWHGDAAGADTSAKLAAKDITGIEIHPFPIEQEDWDRYGYGAGPRRNEKMLRAMLARASESRTAVVMGFAFKDDIKARSGTHDMVQRLLKNDVPVYVVSRPLLEEL